jgi:hypothetical protein
VREQKQQVRVDNAFSAALVRCGNNDVGLHREPYCGERGEQATKGRKARVEIYADKDLKIGVQLDVGFVQPQELAIRAEYSGLVPTDMKPRCSSHASNDTLQKGVSVRAQAGFGEGGAVPPSYFSPAVLETFLNAKALRLLATDKPVVKTLVGPLQIVERSLTIPKSLAPLLPLLRTFRPDDFVYRVERLRVLPPGSDRLLSGVGWWRGYVLSRGGRIEPIHRY